MTHDDLADLLATNSYAELHNPTPAELSEALTTNDGTWTKVTYHREGNAGGSSTLYDSKGHHIVTWV